MVTETKFAADFLYESGRIIDELPIDSIETMAMELAKANRLFILGLGGSAAHASHAAGDFRKLCNKPSFCPTDNAAELTARINDEGWDTCMARWLDTYEIGPRDAVLLLSVGGGSKAVSQPLVWAAEKAKARDAIVLVIVGRDGGDIAKLAKTAVIVPPLYPSRVTPHTEGITSVILHLLATHPALKKNATKW